MPSQATRLVTAIALLAAGAIPTQAQQSPQHPFDPVGRWRFRHALLVQRMVGLGVGTGGSSGFEYLMNTIQSHRIFTDLFAMSTYLIPSQALPALPAEISREMDYRYNAKDDDSGAS